MPRLLPSLEDPNDELQPFAQQLNVSVTALLVRLCHLGKSKPYH
jgi:thioester reductase-like protein